MTPSGLVARLGFPPASARTILVGGMRIPRVVGRPAWRGAAVALVAAAGLMLSACTGSGYHYVKNSDDDSGTYFKIPEGWRVFDENAFYKKIGLSPTRAKIRKATSWTVVFDGDSKPSLKHFDEPVTSQPFGIAEVRELDQQERDSFSLMAMRNLVVPVDDLSQQGAQVEVLRMHEFTSGGFHGLRFTF